MKKLLIVLSMTVSLGAQLAIAGNPDAGRTKAAVCAGCHGINGISAIPTYPNLKGQKEQYLISSLRAYRDGDRNNPMMTPMAKPLSDSDIEDLAAYFSNL